MDGMKGLTYGLIKAGAKAVVGTLFEGYDKEARGLMHHFHKLYSNGVSAENALLLSLQWADGHSWNPLYWASFNLVGDGSVTLT